MNGSELIAKERIRQVEEECYSAKDDADMTDCCLAVAGACYALEYAADHSDANRSWLKVYKGAKASYWPFDEEYFKPTRTDPVRQLVKAGALIAAEIDRLQALEDGK